MHATYVWTDGCVKCMQQHCWMYSPSLWTLSAMHALPRIAMHLHTLSWAIYSLSTVHLGTIVFVLRIIFTCTFIRANILFLVHTCTWSQSVYFLIIWSQSVFLPLILWALCKWSYICKPLSSVHVGSAVYINMLSVKRNIYYLSVTYDTVEYAQFWCLCFHYYWMKLHPTNHLN